MKPTTRLLVAFVLGIAAVTAIWAVRHPIAPSDLSRATVRHRVAVNCADVDELQLLPGIGPALAERIIDDRRRLGAFHSVSDLRRVKGIGPRTAAEVAPHVRFEEQPPRATGPVAGGG